jgi:hypothetical protein
MNFLLHLKRLALVVVPLDPVNGLSDATAPGADLCCYQLKEREISINTTTYNGFV